MQPQPFQASRARPGTADTGQKDKRATSRARYHILVRRWYLRPRTWDAAGKMFLVSACALRNRPMAFMYIVKASVAAGLRYRVPVLHPPRTALFLLEYDDALVRHANRLVDINTHCAK